MGKSFKSNGDGNSVDLDTAGRILFHFFIIILLSSSFSFTACTNKLGSNLQWPALSNILSPSPSTGAMTANLTGDGVTDNTDQLQSQIIAASSALQILNIPPGDFVVSDSITLPSHTYIQGAKGGTSHLIQQSSGKSTFVTRGTASGFITNIEIHDLTFSGPAGVAALSFTSTDNVNIDSNIVNQMSLLKVATYLNINNWDGTKDPATTAGLTQASQLSKNYRITNNNLNGANIGSGISVAYASDVSIGHNVVRDYQNGIVWWGGDSNPTREGDPVNPRWAQRIAITDNTVTHSSGAIWGSMGQDITVSGNTVQGCADVCLDAEGSNNVVFSGNSAANATNGVLSVFFFSKNIQFNQNVVSQDGALGTNLMITRNPAQFGSDIQISVDSNQFLYTGKSGLGIVSKESSALFTFTNNQLSNVAAAFISNNAGVVEIKNNTFNFTRPLQTTAALAVGNNDRGSLLVFENRIFTDFLEQKNVAVFVNQTDFNATNVSTILSNEIRGFSNSIDFIGHSQNAGIKFSFVINNNAISGKLSNLSPPGRSLVSSSGNRKI